ncbi:hypothetical protein F7Q99_32410 [Streptomyces kaniharaensis]|uniref:Uncharacterized protein n=1 Tax=Streptomyces kaniharaensis TaxID=212423 RepID=A0A6N7KYK8_9ACTN|nr:hypothetical protein [Streptomyces kaniharaensis]MQS16766.1 hypothetical protein [Streptomyces kaniharaensis]
MGTMLNRATAEQRREAASVVDDLTTVLALGGAKLPSLEVDWEYGRLTGCYLINLGSARTREVLRIVDLLRKGLRYERLTYDD